MSEYAVQGKLNKILQIEEGVSKSSGKAWKKVVFEVTNNDGYQGKEKLFAFEVFGDERVDNFLKYNEEGSTVSVKFDINVNEWNGRYFTTLSAFHVQSGEAVEQASHTPPTPQPKQEPVNVDGVGEDSLPF